MTAWNSSHSETKPLSGGKAEMASAPTRKKSGGARHAMDETAQPVEVAAAGGVQDGAGAEEEQGLEPRMIEHMQECRRHRHGRRLVLGVGAEGQSQAQRHEDHADILDRRIGQDALEVAVEHARRAAPSTAVIAPRMMGGSAHHQAGGPSRSKAMRTKP